VREAAFERHQAAGEDRRLRHARAHLHDERLAEVEQRAVEVDEAHIAIHQVEVREGRLRVIQALHCLLDH